MIPFMARVRRPTATPDRCAYGLQIAGSSSTGAAREQIIGQTIASMVKTEALRPAVIEQSLASDSTVSAQGFHDLIVTDLRPDLANIRVPLLVLYVLPQGAPLTAEQIDQYYAASYANAPNHQVRRVQDSYHFIRSTPEPSARLRRLSFSGHDPTVCAVWRPP